MQTNLAEIVRASIQKLKHIAKSAYGCDKCRVLGVLFQLLPQSPNVGVHTLTREFSFHSPNRFSQLDSREDAVWMCHKKMEQPKFDRAGWHSLFPSGHAIRCRIDSYASDFDHFLHGKIRISSPKECSNACHQLSQLKWLCDVGIRTEFEANDTISLFTLSGEDKNGESIEPEIDANLFANSE